MSPVKSPIERALRCVVGAAAGAPPDPSVYWPPTDWVAAWEPDFDAEHLGPALTGRIGAAHAAGLESLPDAELLDVLAAGERQIAALQAGQYKAMAEWARRHPRQQTGPRTSPGEVDEFAATELAARLTWTDARAGERLTTAQQLAATLPRTLQLLAAGRIDDARARTIARGAALLDDDAAKAVDAAIAADAPELTTGKLRRRVAREAAAVDAANAARRAENGRRTRAVRTWPLPDGLAELAVTGPATDIHTIYTAINGLAADRDPRDPCDGDGADARRFDALTDLAQSILDTAECGQADAETASRNDQPPATNHAPVGPAQTGESTTGTAEAGDAFRRPRRRRFRGATPHLTVVVHQSTLDGTDDHPAELVGHGPIPASQARDLAAAGGPRRTVLVDEDGILLAVANHTTRPADPPPGDDPPLGDDPPGGGPPGDDPPGDDPGEGPGDGPRDPAPGPARASSTTATLDAGRWQVDDRHDVADCPREPLTNVYRPCRRVDRLVRLRDARCTYPGCNAAAVRCDLDHVLRHPDGPTCPCNLHPLCRRHHRMKHVTATTVTRAADGTLIWTLPAGHSHRRRPESVLARPTVQPVNSDPVPLIEPAVTDYGSADYLALTDALRGRGAADVEPQKRPASAPVDPEHLPAWRRKPPDYDGPPPF